MKVIYGLGNPGKRYIFTRHNIGYMVVDLLSMEWRIPMRGRSKGVLHGKGTVDGISIMLAKPYTYMNLSGNPLKYLKIDPDDLCVVHDDIDLPLGIVRVKKGGGTGGHKGLKSVLESMASERFLRVRCGIGRPREGVDPADYVLSPFNMDQMKIVKKQIDLAVDVIYACVVHGVEYAMNAYNRRGSENQKR